jgi:hypothetical protein
MPGVTMKSLVLPTLAPLLVVLFACASPRASRMEPTPLFERIGLEQRGDAGMR